MENIQILQGIAAVDTGLWLILFTPLISLLVCSFISEKYSWSVSLIATVLLLISSSFAVATLFEYWDTPTIFKVGWISLSESSIGANLAISNHSLVMMVIVTVVSFLVHLYSIGYMAGDLHVKRYFGMLGFFTFSMLGVVLADSLLLLFLFWELVGFSSYLLIGHYQENNEAARAAKKAFLFNRLGDAGFIIGILIVWTFGQSLDLQQLALDRAATGWKTAASLAIFCGVIGKSAQFPLFTWLPDAMQGPTPVSALIHAATMVAAGVYLMTRVYFLFTPDALVVVAVVGTITAVIGGVSALFQYDIKKLLAYSTVSQLGLMMMAIGVGAVDGALLHLYTHAFFKACLFLGAGAVIHALHHAQRQSQEHFDAQDIRNMGGLRRHLPVTFWCVLASGASLSGIPLFSGFLSKEAMLNGALQNPSPSGLIIFAVMAVVSFLTVLYTCRLIWFVFLGQRRLNPQVVLSEVPVVMRIPLVFLAVCSVWIFFSWNPFDFRGWILPAGAAQSTIVLFTSLSVVLAGVLVAWIVFRKSQPGSVSIFRKSFYVDRLITRGSTLAAFSLARASQYLDDRVIDRSIHYNAYGQVTLAHVVQWFDIHIVDGTVRVISKTLALAGYVIRSFQGGKIQLYIFWAVIAIIIFLIYALN